MEQRLLWHPPLQVHCLLLQQLGAPLALLALLGALLALLGAPLALLALLALLGHRWHCCHYWRPEGFVPLATRPPMSLHACPIQALEEWRQT